MIMEKTIKCNSFLLGKDWFFPAYFDKETDRPAKPSRDSLPDIGSVG